MPKSKKKPDPLKISTTPVSSPGPDTPRMLYFLNSPVLPKRNQKEPLLFKACRYLVYGIYLVIFYESLRRVLFASSETQNPSNKLQVQDDTGPFSFPVLINALHLLLLQYLQMAWNSMQNLPLLFRFSKRENYYFSCLLEQIENGFQHGMDLAYCNAAWETALFNLENENNVLFKKLCTYTNFLLCYQKALDADLIKSKFFIEISSQLSPRTFMLLKNNWPLTLALANRNAKATEQLLKLTNADVNLENKFGTKPIFALLYSMAMDDIALKNYPISEPYLISFGTWAGLIRQEGSQQVRTPLPYKPSENQAIFKLLLAHHLELDFINQDQFTPLEFAIIYGLGPMVEAIQTEIETQKAKKKTQPGLSGLANIGWFGQGPKHSETAPSLTEETDECPVQDLRPQ